MRGVPGMRLRGVGEAGAIDMAHLDLAEVAARIVGAGHVHVSRERRAVRLRAGHDVVIVRREADPGDLVAPLRQARRLVELVVGAVEIVDAGGDDVAFEVLPGSLAKLVARAGCPLWPGPAGFRSQISVPGLAAGAH